MDFSTAIMSNQTAARKIVRTNELVNCLMAVFALSPVSTPTRSRPNLLTIQHWSSNIINRNHTTCGTRFSSSRAIALTETKSLWVRYTVTYINQGNRADDKHLPDNGADARVRVLLFNVVSTKSNREEETCLVESKRG